MSSIAARIQAALRVITSPSSINVKSANCSICGQKFEWISDGVGRNKKFCSEECKKKAHYEASRKWMNRRYEEDEEYREKIRERSRTYQKRRAEEMRKAVVIPEDRSWTVRLICEVCGEEFTQERTSRSKRLPKYCSDKCRSMHRRRYRNEYMVERYRTDDSFREERKEQSRKAYRERIKRGKGENDGE